MRHKKAEAAEIQAQAAEAEAAQKRPMVLPGSKAPVRFMDADVVDDGGKVLPGSKIGEVIRLRVEDPPAASQADQGILPPPPAEAAVIEPAEERRMRILPSSKSAGIIDPEDFIQKPGQPQGSGTINRNNIDEVLNNPKRVQPPAQKEAPKQQPAKPAEP